MTLPAAEEWHPAVGYEEEIEVSTFGRIRQRSTRKIVRGWKHHCGYVVIDMVKNGKRRKEYVHRLVAQTFLGPARSRNVNHKDGKPANNHVCNLEYLTQADNIRHAYRLGLNGRAKLNGAKARQILELRATMKYKDIAAMFGVSVSTIEDVFHKGRWKHAMEEPNGNDQGSK